MTKEEILARLYLIVGKLDTKEHTEHPVVQDVVFKLRKLILEIEDQGLETEYPHLDFLGG